MRHVHIGAGALGLGLIAQLTGAEHDIDVSVVQRAGGGSARKLESLARSLRYERVIASNKTHPDSWPSCHIGISEAFALESREELQRVICDPSCLLLTVALGEGGLDAQVPLLSSLLEKRAASPAGSPLCVIACENTVGEEYLRLSRRSLDGVVFVRCLVDRMCSLPTIGSDGVVRVETEDYGSWLIERVQDGTEEIEDALSGVHGVDFVDDLPRWRMRKRWLMNAPHLAAGIFAQNANNPHIDDYVNESAAIFRAVQLECLEAFHVKSPEMELDALRGYNEEIFGRVSSFPMLTRKVLRRLHPDRLEELLRTSNEIIIGPSSAYMQSQHHPPGILTSVLHTMIDLVDSRNYVG
nr:hypothetical protein [Streptomyces sp. DSM 41633]